MESFYENQEISLKSEHVIARFITCVDTTLFDWPPFLLFYSSYEFTAYVRTVNATGEEAIRWYVDCQRSTRTPMPVHLYMLIIT